ncbi:MAG: ATP-binding protein, partial [Chloroflexi bacterium CFX6]|nr:ATP-binding protein [Chloroflexi bacterium CFX6]
MAPRWRHLGRFTAATFTPVAEAQGIRLDLERPEQLPAVSVDPGRIAQVLHNLLSNALHHSPAGGVVTLSAEADGAEVVLAARDTGEGIAAEDLPHVFDRFYHADRSRSHQRGGVGLGLAIARSLVVAHGGSLTLIEQPALRGVPNTACTEAFAFLFQSLGRRVVGFASPPGAPDPFDVDA